MAQIYRVSVLWRLMVEQEYFLQLQDPIQHMLAVVVQVTLMAQVQA
jgi:hypothetical protein